MAISDSRQFTSFEFAPVIAKNGDVATLLEALSVYIKTEYIGIILRFFAYMAIASSF